MRSPEVSDFSKYGRIFLPSDDMQVTNTSFFAAKPHARLSCQLVKNLCETSFGEVSDPMALLYASFLPYMRNLTAYVCAQHQRIVADRELDEWAPGDEPIIFDEKLLKGTILLQRQFRHFRAQFSSSTDPFEALAGTATHINQLLKDIIADHRDLSVLYQVTERRQEHSMLTTLIQFQIDEAQQSNETSVKLKFLSQLTYVFLPLQLTVSALGMNLKNFGTGNVDYRTLFHILFVILVLSLGPVVFLPVLVATRHRVGQCQQIWPHSRRVAVLFGYFCLFHRHSTNDKLWRSGILRDIAVFNSETIGPRRVERVLSDGPQRTVVDAFDHDHYHEDRQTLRFAINSGLFVLSPVYWSRIVDEIYAIIDQPQWGKLGAKQHTT